MRSGSTNGKRGDDVPAIRAAAGAPPAVWEWTSSTWAALVVVAITAACMRFADLGRAAVRSDEINFLELAARGQSLLALWRDPPWTNQIPFADSIAIVWHWFRPGQPNEQTVREPFAILGTLTVIGVAVWLTRWRGIAAGALVGLWMALLPFHVYHSREAYYYVVVMAWAAGMTLSTADFAARLQVGDPIPAAGYAVWTAFTLLTCLSHMSTWVVALLCWGFLLGMGRVGLPGAGWRRHLIAMLACAVVIGAFMDRWVWRAIDLVGKSATSRVHIGDDFGWVAPRVLPFFTAGVNLLGIVATVAVMVAGACRVHREWRKPRADRDHLYAALTVIVLFGSALVVAYVGAVGGGLAKLTYFSVMLPVFLVWASATFDGLAGGLPGRWSGISRLALPIVIGVALVKPAWMITRLDGRPTPYKKLRAWLDENLDAGSVVLIDRWFEPWNEMARYAPAKVFVTFTVPDEPYETYRQLRWREVTQQAIEQGKAQAFIRLVRNYESRDGLWTWPETFFAHRAVVSDEAGLWLRERGYAPAEEFYAANRNRLVTEIFFDRHADILARKKAAGDRFAVFFDPAMRFMKSGPMQMFPIKTEQFMDWRLLEETGELQVHNLGQDERRASLKVRAVSPAGGKTVVGPEGQRHQFSGGQLEEWVLGPLNLKVGENSISLRDSAWASEHRPLLIGDVEVVPEDDSK